VLRGAWVGVASEDLGAAERDAGIQSVRGQRGAFVVGDPSPFAPGQADTFDAIKFLIRFAETLREPKPKELGRHYLPTQIFTAYLLATHETLRPDAIKYASSLDPQSENWVVNADNEHCADADSKGLSPDDIYLLLDPNTVTFVSARDYVEPEHEAPIAR